MPKENLSEEKAILEESLIWKNIEKILQELPEDEEYLRMVYLEKAISKMRKHSL